MLRRDIAALLKLNLIFLVCCLPLISIPAALQAMTKVNVSLIEGRRTEPAADFLNAFRDLFFDALLHGLLIGALFFLFGYVAWFYQTMHLEHNLILIYLRYMTVLPLLVLYCMSCYLLTINCKRDFPRLRRMKNAFFLTVVCIRSTLLCLLCGGIFGAIVFLGMPYSMPFLFVGAFSVWNYITTYYTLPMITTFL